MSFKHTNHYTPEAAKNYICPLQNLAKCLGGSCVLWHWEYVKAVWLGYCGWGVKPKIVHIKKGRKDD